MRDEVEGELLAGLLARDDSALRRVIALHEGPVYAMARKVLVDPVLAEDVAQDTFIALWRRPGAFDPERGSMRSFLVGVARNKAIDLVRKEESLRRTKGALLAENEGMAPKSPGTTIEKAEQRHDLITALGRLSAAQREALVLAYFGGRTYREVAAELDIPEGTARTRLRDGLIKLRAVMERQEGR